MLRFSPFGAWQHPCRHGAGGRAESSASSSEANRRLFSGRRRVSKPNPRVTHVLQQGHTSLIVLLPGRGTYKPSQTPSRFLIVLGSLSVLSAYVPMNPSVWWRRQRCHLLEIPGVLQNTIKLNCQKYLKMYLVTVCGGTSVICNHVIDHC